MNNYKDIDGARYINYYYRPMKKFGDREETVWLAIGITALLIVFKYMGFW